MNMPEWTKPGLWGVVGGAVAAIAIGFSVGGWVTGGTAKDMAETSAEAAIVEAFTPLCVANAQQDPDKLAQLKGESSWQRDTFVEKAGWADGAGPQYRGKVADACAPKAVQALEANAAKKPS